MGLGPEAVVFKRKWTALFSPPGNARRSAVLKFIEIHALSIEINTPSSSLHYLSNGHLILNPKSKDTPQLQKDRNRSSALVVPVLDSI